MRKTIMVLMDPEREYAVSFMELINRRRTVPYEVHAFTEIEKLEEFLSRKRVEVMLISEQAVCEKAVGFGIPTVIILSERNSPGRAEAAELSAIRDIRKRTVAEGWNRIYKYQPASNVMKEVMEITLEKSDGEILREDGSILKTGMKTVGVFSPIGRVMKTSFAAAIGQCLGKRKPTLFLTLDACTGFSGLTHMTSDRNMSDAFYYIRRGEDHMMGKILPMIREVGRMSFLPPFSRAQELYSVTDEEWRKLIAGIKQESTFEILVLDLGQIPLLYPSILEECDRIYVPLRKDALTRVKMEEFEKLLHDSAMDPIRQRMSRLSIQPGKLPERSDRWLEMLPFSGLGALAEEYIERDRLAL